MGSCLKCNRLIERNDVCIICTRLDGHDVVLSEILALLVDVKALAEAIGKYKQ